MNPQMTYRLALSRRDDLLRRAARRRTKQLKTTREPPSGTSAARNPLGLRPAWLHRSVGQR
jgi:hypothetical protein